MLESLAIKASQQSDSQLSPSEMPSRFWGRLSSSSGPSPSPTRSTLSMLPGGLQLRQKVACLLINLKIWQTSGHTSRLGRRSGSRLTDACKPSSAAQVACGSYHPMESQGVCTVQRFATLLQTLQVLQISFLQLLAIPHKSHN